MVFSKKNTKSNKNDCENEKKGFFFIPEKDFSKKNVIIGGVIRPLIQIISFFSFVIAIFLLLFSLKAVDKSFYLKWCGSGIVFSFVLNMYSIYVSLCDKPSIFKNMNLAFKLVLFVLEIITFNWVLSFILY